MHSTTGPLRDVHRVILRREEGGRRQVARRIKEGNEKEGDRSASNHFPKCSPPSGTHRNSELDRVERG